MAKTVYARGIGGNWSTDATWSSASGGGADTTKPVAGDTVYLDGASGSVTVDVDSACAILNCGSYTGTLLLAANLATTGNVTLVAGMTFTPGTYTWTVTGTATLNFASKSLYGLTFGGTGTYTLSAAVTVTNLLTVKSGTVTIATSDITCQGGITNDSFGIIQGTGRKITLTGSGTWQCGGSTAVDLGRILCSLTINTAGTIVLGTRVAFATGTLTWTAGTMTTAGSQLILLGSATLATNGMAWNDVKIMSTCTLTLTNALDIDGTLTVSAQLSIATSDITLAGSLVADGTILGNTRTITFDGTGSWSGLYAVYPNVTFNTAGTITLGSRVAWGNGTGTLKWIAGTVDAITNSTLLTVYVQSNAVTLDLDGVTLYDLLLLGSTAAAGKFQFKAGKTLNVAHKLSMYVPVGCGGICTDSATNASKLICAQTGQFPMLTGPFTAVDIDSSGGFTVLNEGGTNTRCTNWVNSWADYPKLPGVAFAG